MEASAVATPTAPPEPEASHDGVAEATRTTEELFQWSGYAHVGGGADECEHALDGQCKESRHFHAWVCLPNQFQIRDIAEKARAAKARKVRALRDPSSDAYEVLELELEELRRDHYDELVKAIARGVIEKQLVDIMAEMGDDERFEHQSQDAEEFRRLQALPEDERDAEEYERLEADLRAYGDRFQEIVTQREQREEERLRGCASDEVVELERKARIDQVANEVYLHTYYTWSMYIGARVPTTEGFPSKRKFDKPDDLRGAAPEVVSALREKIRELEERTTVRGDAAGN